VGTVCRSSRAFHRRLLDRGKAVELGLADGIGHLVPKMKELFGDKTRFAVYGQKRNLFGRFGLSIASDIATGLEERAAYARFGLS
jgi:ClpP class serine protease